MTEEAKKQIVAFSELKLSLHEIYSYMGYPNSVVPDPYITSILNEQINDIKNITNLCFGFKKVDGRILNEYSIFISGHNFHSGRIITKCLKNSDYFVIILATVGDNFNSWMLKIKEKNDIIASYISDALASAVVESLVKYALSYRNCKVKKLDEKISNSYSPGYCGWNISEQRKLFSLLPNSFCDVTLTESSLMLPIKSVSAVVGVGKNIKYEPYGCAICNMKNCYKRKK